MSLLQCEYRRLMEQNEIKLTALLYTPFPLLNSIGRKREKKETLTAQRKTLTPKASYEFGDKFHFQEFTLTLL